MIICSENYSINQTLKTESVFYIQDTHLSFAIFLSDCDPVDYEA